MKVMKRVDPALLQQELTAAGVPYRNIGAWNTEVAGEVDVVDHDEYGFPKEPAPEAETVINAHVAPPRVVEYAGAQQVSSIFRTTDDQPAEVFRLPTAQRHIYRATLRMTAVDANSGACKDAEARMLFKRLAASVVQVGATAVTWQAQDTAASAWGIQAGVSGTDFIISVKGAVGRTIDWLLVGDIGVYAPGGLPAPPTPPVF
jgi:hypothetical protein